MIEHIHGVFMNIKLSDHFTYRRVLRFALPSISMTIITFIYSVIDGSFVSNFAGKNVLAAICFIYRNNTRFC